MKDIEEDYQAWDVFGNTEHRWVFNKLEVALRQGLHAGPAASAPKFSGTYIHRPTYNIYGMGIGAKKFEYNKDIDHNSIINHDIVPPGHFWCEWVEGEHLSIDYEQDDLGFWHTRSAWLGQHDSKDNLTKFSSWLRLDAGYAPKWNELPIDLSFLYDPDVKKANLEMIGNKIIEIHLRWGNDPFDEYPVGTRLTPVWDDEEAPEGEWKGNLHEDLESYSANGFLSNVRRGYVVERPQS
jgi:hypothetical protein